jgi:hypothetical protein
MSRSGARCAVRLGWVIMMPNQTKCRPGRRANKQATKVSRQSQNRRRGEKSRVVGGRDDKISVRRSSSNNNAAVWGQGECLGKDAWRSSIRSQCLQDALRLGGSDADWAAPLPSGQSHTRHRTQAHAAIHLVDTLLPPGHLLFPFPSDPLEADISRPCIGPAYISPLQRTTQRK